MKFLTKIILIASSALIYSTVSFSQSQLNGHSIKFLNNTEGTLVGEDGAIMKTTNAGINWSLKNSGLTNVLYGNAFSNENVQYCVGENGLILKTSDDGETWRIRKTGTLENLKKVYAGLKTSVVACGENGTILISNDLGETWTLKNGVTSNNLNYVACSPSLTLYIVGENSTILKSSDNGNSWSLIQFETGNYNFESIGLVDDNNYTVVGSDFTILNTNDGGKTWSVPMTNNIGGTKSDLHEIIFLDALRAVIVGSQGKILKSTDGGASWQSVILKTTNTYDFFSVAFYSPTNGIIISPETKLFFDDKSKSYSNKTSINDTGFDSKCNLSQNFPNPFNPSTVIGYSLPFNASVTVKIFDMLGKEVKTLVNKYQNAGSYSVRFDGANLSSGIYFYSLKVNSGNKEFSKTMRMILTK